MNTRHFESSTRLGFILTLIVVLIFSQVGQAIARSSLIDFQSNVHADLQSALAFASSANAIAAGGSHTCTLTTSGGVKCWGSNNYGGLGDGTTTNRTTPADVSGLTSGVSAIAAGSEYTCALVTSGGVKCWGLNGLRQLGDGTTANRATPVDVSGLTSGVSGITAGLAHVCALMTNGSVKCWGG